MSRDDARQVNVVLHYLFTHPQLFMYQPTRDDAVGALAALANGAQRALGEGWKPHEVRECAEVQRQQKLAKLRESAA